MTVPKWISPLFWLSAAYDGLLGLLFLAVPGWVFTRLEVALPNHVAYVQFSAALLLIFGLIFVNIARDPIANRSQIIYGILLKVAYCGLAFYYWATEAIPWIWEPFAVIDLVMGVLFVIAYASLPANGKLAMTS
jgi:hypothetical protein